MLLISGLAMVVIAIMLDAMNGMRERIRRLEHENRELKQFLGKRP